jgi:hypothetical protein
MKYLYYLRHSDKGIGEYSQFIMEAGLKWAADTAPERDFRIQHFFHGTLIRTAQTLLSAVTKRGFVGTVHPPIAEIGDNELFASWKEKGVKFGSGLSNFQAMGKGLSKLQFNMAVSHCFTAVKKMFEKIGNGEIGLAYGHSPCVELAIYATRTELYGGEQLQSCEGALFTMDELNLIKVKEMYKN